MAPKKFHYNIVLYIARRLHTKQISPVELTEYMRKRIASKDKKLRSYATITEELARRQANKAEQEIQRGHIRGPLHGVPIAVKDLCYTRGIATAAGMAIHKDFNPRYNATVVKRFADAGAVLLGKLQMTEGAFAEHQPGCAAPRLGRTPGARQHPVCASPRLGRTPVALSDFPPLQMV